MGMLAVSCMCSFVAVTHSDDTSVTDGSERQKERFAVPDGPSCYRGLMDMIRLLAEEQRGTVLIEKTR